MYKLGPTHQVIIERGSKTASDSYILWPAKVGAFTVVMGRHYKNSDTSDLPFSYLIEHEDESVLVPGVNLRNVGTVRDARKWPRRDRRKDKRKLDYINFKLLSPYTIQKMLNGCRLLANLKATSGQNTDYFTFGFHWNTNDVFCCCLGFFVCFLENSLIILRIIDHHGFAGLGNYSCNTLTHRNLNFLQN